MLFETILPFEFRSTFWIWTKDGLKYRYIFGIYSKFVAHMFRFVLVHHVDGRKDGEQPEPLSGMNEGGGGFEVRWGRREDKLFSRSMFV